jgi:GNAT superfamily N-acetyltransferase
MLALVRLSDAPDGEGRARFLRQFADSAPCLRAGALAERAPSRAYTETVLEVALRRPAELFLAVAGERVVGRAAVVASYATPAAAALGLFEVHLGATRDGAARLLIDAACEWARERDYEDVFAPVDVNTWFSYRFLVPPSGAGAAVRPCDWEPAQPREYLELFRRRGFGEAERYRTVGGTFDDRADGRVWGPVRYTARAYDDATAAGYHFERLTDVARLDALLGEVPPLCMHAFRDSLLFEPLPAQLFRQLFASAAAAHDCTPTHLARDPAGRLAAFAFAFVDGDAVVVKTIAVRPDVRGRRLSTALVHLVLARGAECGYRRFVSALVRRGNASELLAHPYLLPGLRTWTHEYVLLRRSVAPR